jgi:predicted small metal-binding protein
LDIKMKQFSCGDVVPGCQQRFVGSESEILSAVAVHARNDHQMNEIPPSVADEVRRRIVAV